MRKEIYNLRKKRFTQIGTMVGTMKINVREYNKQINFTGSYVHWTPRDFYQKDCSLVIHISDAGELYDRYMLHA